MLLHFYKMTGAGNDFVMLDNRDLSLSPILEKDTIAMLCDRRFGIGGDGLIAVEPAQGEGDYRMRYYNSDGGEAEMCGNGARCFAAFASALDDDEPMSLSFETQAGLINATIHEDYTVTVNLTTPHSLELNKVAASDVIPSGVHFINTGVPHAVVFVDDLSKINIRELGAHLRYHEAFAPAGTNVNFVQLISPSHIAIRTYERGVEDETLACGTGMTASALIYALLNDTSSPVKVDVAGGDTLAVGFVKNGNDFSDVTLTGPADFVFDGAIELEDPS